MADIETVDGSNKLMDPLYRAQQEGVGRMRAALLACSFDDLLSCRHAINQITVLRIYHQVSRIIKYLALMDKLEDKMYQSIEATIDRSSPDSATTWVTLLKIQEQLQKNMIDSQNLLKPYLNEDTFAIVDDIPQGSTTSGTRDIIDAQSRENLRASSQKILDAIEAGKLDE